jgi:hypothetical protein
MLNILYPQQYNRTLPAVLDSCTFYFCLARAYISSAISYCLDRFRTLLYFFIHLNILFFSLCISLSFTIYHGIRASAVSLFPQSGEPHDPHGAELTRILRERDTDFFTRFGKPYAILFKDRRNKLAEEAERTTLERSWTKRTQKKKP